MEINAIYPEFKDIQIACEMIAYNHLTSMLSKEETLQFQELATKWIYNLRVYKKELIDEMISELDKI